MDDNTKNAKTIQCAIILLSNHRVGVRISNNFKPRGIFKYEGGAVVNGKEIVIKRNAFTGEIICYNDWDSVDQDTPKIVETATEEILTLPDIETIPPFLVAQTGARLELIQNLINEFVETSTTNNLTSIFK